MYIYKNITNAFVCRSFWQRKRKIAVLEHKLKNKREEERKNQKSTLQSEILELLFGLYVHVIKSDMNRRLLGVVLEGLAK